MNSKKKFSLLLVLTLVLSMFLAACAGGSDDKNKEDNGQNTGTTGEKENGGDLVIATLSDAAMLDPHLSTDVPSINIQQNIFETLIAKDKDEKLVPGLATSWEPVDETTWVFELREDVTFHEREIFNAEVA